MIGGIIRNLIGCFLAGFASGFSHGSDPDFLSGLVTVFFYGSGFWIRSISTRSDDLIFKVIVIEKNLCLKVP